LARCRAPHFSTLWKIIHPASAGFSTVWNFCRRFFHSVEKMAQSCSIVWKSGLKVVPLCGKNRVPGRGFFHSVELLSPIFPQCGTFAVDFSTAWKIPLMRDKYISTVWNFCCGFFHSVENPADAG